MLSSLECKNFRCLEQVEMPLSPLTALVGPNGSGKSAVLRAIDLVVGPTWPALQRLRFPQDFSGYDDSRELLIKVGFAVPATTERDRLGTQHHIHGLRVRCRPYKRKTGKSPAGDPNFDYEPYDAAGDVPLACIEAIQGRPQRQIPHRVTSDLRDHGACVLIDHRRAITQHLPGTRGSVLARLLAPASKELDKLLPDDERGRTRREVYAERYEAAVEMLRSPYIQEVEATIDSTARQALGFMGATARDAHVSFRIADPVNPYSSLRLVYSEDGLDFPAEDVGLGVQSAIVVGIFEALRGKRTSAGTVLIDEPEMYLHPQAQRHFHRILVELVEQGQTQVIYSTHSPVFADATRFDSLRLVRRPPGKSSAAAYVRRSDRAPLETAKSAVKLLTEYDSERSEALFADAVLLVEGRADRLAARAVAKRLQIDLDAKNLTVMECGGKSGIPFHAALCRALGIPVCVLHDDDQWPPVNGETDDEKKKREDHAATEAALNVQIAEAVPDGSNRFVCTPTLEHQLGIGRHAASKPLKAIEAVRAAKDRGGVPTALIDAVERLATVGAA